MYGACLQHAVSERISTSALQLKSGAHTNLPHSLITLWFTSQSGLRLHDLGSFGVKLTQKWASGMHTYTPSPQHQLFLLYRLAPTGLHLLVNIDIEMSSFV